MKTIAYKKWQKVAEPSRTHPGLVVAGSRPPYKGPLLCYHPQHASVSLGKDVGPDRQNVRWGAQDATAHVAYANMGAGA